jgi:hypothetical protein
MGTKRPLQLCCYLAAIALGACFEPVAEPGESSNGGSTGTVQSGSSGGGTGSTAGTTGGTGAGGDTSTGGGSGTTTGGVPDAGIVGLGAPCSTNTAADDPCRTYGLRCSMLLCTPGVCVLPGEEWHCLSQVGCSSPDLLCLGDPNGVCKKLCKTDWDCPSLKKHCQTYQYQGAAARVCGYNKPCAGSPAGGFATCDSSGRNDGTCYPDFACGDSKGICISGGQGAVGDACLDHRTPTGTPGDLCSPGMVCFPLDSPTGGHCSLLCVWNDGGAACPSPTSCLAPPNGFWNYCH